MCVLQDVPDAHQRLFTFFRCGVEDGIVSSSFLLRLPECFLSQLITSLKKVDDVDEEVLAELELQFKK